jgi:hypothetical protein
VLSTQAISRFGSVFRAFGRARKFTTKTLESFLGLSQMTGVLDCLTVRIGVEVSQSNIQSKSLTRWLSLLYPFLVKAKLNVVPISSTNNTHSLNLLQLVEVKVTSSPHLEASCFKPISEGDSSSIERQLPARCFIFNRAMCLMLLKAWEAFLPWLAFFTIVIKPSDRTPSPLGRSLPSLGIKFAGPRKLFGENSAIGAQLVLANPQVVQPVSKAAIADKSSSANGFIESLVLLCKSL